MVWAEDGCNLRWLGGLMLWPSQHQNTNQGRVRPNWSGKIKWVGVRIKLCWSDHKF